MKQHAPAADRNREPLLAVLRDVLPPSGLVLEVASGTGQHAVYFASQLPTLLWQPSDPDPGARTSIDAWRKESGLANVLPPLALDATAPTWPFVRADAVLNVNMIHIAPWEAALGLLHGAASVLAAGAPLVMYGPYIRHGVETAPSNLSFDADLRQRNPAWGVRRLEDVVAAASVEGLELDRVVEMPANNLTVVYRRR